jgi:hypothetical protein
LAALVMLTLPVTWAKVPSKVSVWSTGIGRAARHPALQRHRNFSFESFAARCSGNSTTGSWPDASSARRAPD